MNTFEHAADYAQAIAEIVAGQFEPGKQKAKGGKRSRSPQKAIAASGSATDKDDSSSTKSETTLGYLALSLICIDGGTQSRAALNDETIDEYAQAMDAGAFFPPVTVFYDGEEYWLADGFHRVAAAKKLEWTDIAVEILQGSRREAVLHSVGANATHGLRRTNADKRRAVMTLLQDEEWTQWPDKKIAQAAAVTREYVVRLRKKLIEEGILSCDRSQDGERIVNRAGKTYTQNTTNIGKNHRNTPETDIVERLEQKDTAPPPILYQVGSVVEIRAGCNPTLRKHDGMWGIVTHVGHFACTVHISLRNVNVQCKPDEMDPVDPKYTQQIQEVSDRVAVLSRCDLDPAAWSILETLNKQICFTQFQLDLLAWVEERYGIKTYDN